MRPGPKIWLAALGVLAVVVVAGLAAIRIAFQLPAPTGKYAVGTVVTELDRPLEPGEASRGTFPVQIWYPAESGGDRAPYGTSIGSLKHRLYHVVVRTNAAREVALAGARDHFPVLVYAAGWGGERSDNTSLLEDLASHGFVVAAFGDVHYDSPPLERLDQGINLSSDRAYRETLRVASARLDYLARRASAVLDYLTILNARDLDGRFTGKLDLSRIGVLGYSFGGAVAVKSCETDRRFKAAMNMDGLLFDAGSQFRAGTPYFSFSDATTKPGPKYVADPNLQIRYASQLMVADMKSQHEILRHGGYELIMDGANHMTFSDVPLFAPKHRFARGDANPRRLANAIHAYTLAFFEQALNGTPSPLLVAGHKQAPAMTLASWPLRPE